MKKVIVLLVGVALLSGVSGAWAQEQKVPKALDAGQYAIDIGNCRYHFVSVRDNNTFRHDFNQSIVVQTGGQEYYKTDDGSMMKDLQQKVIEFRDARNWRQYHTPKNLAQALASEVGELNDLFLWDREAAPSKVFLEVADIAIYLLSLCDVMGIDLKLAIEEKLRINENKYPVERASGNARKYTEL